MRASDSRDAPSGKPANMTAAASCARWPNHSAKRPPSTLHTVPLLPSKPVTAASGAQRCLFECGDLDHTSGLFAQTGSGRGHATLDVDAPFLADAVALKAYAHDLS